MHYLNRWESEMPQKKLEDFSRKLMQALAPRFAERHRGTSVQAQEVLSFWLNIIWNICWNQLSAGRALQHRNPRPATQPDHLFWIGRV